jgi:NAD(P)-dependent dehydrogenase (short-subunit alcohol dehydrogenase family)
MSISPFSLAGKTIFVTGASSGIGRSIAVECSKMGATLVITGRNEDRLNETFHLLKNGAHKQFVADLAKTSELEVLVDSLENLDGLVFSAGINDKSLVKFINEEKVDHMMSINFRSPALVLKQLMKKKKINKKASVVFMSSISAFYPTIGNALYAASKGALNSFAKVLALEFLSQRVRVNCIQPAFVETSMLEKYALQEEIQKIKDNYPLGRFAKPEEIAYAVIYFLSDASEWITGNFFTMDGGFTLR